MEKEKLTLESVVEVIRDNTLTSDGVELLTNLLKQIRDEIEYDYSSFSAICKVFNKYLNEK